MSPAYRRPSGIYAVRLYIPERLQPIFRKRELHISTRCRSTKIAKIIASDLRARWHRTLHLLSQMNPERIKQFLPALLGHGYISAGEVSDLFESTPQRIIQMMCAGNFDFYVRPQGLEGWFIKDIEQDLGLNWDNGTPETSIVPQALNARYVLTSPTAMLSFYFSEDRSVYSGDIEKSALPCVFRQISDSRIFVLNELKEPIAADEICFLRSDVEHLRIGLIDKIRDATLENKKSCSTQQKIQEAHTENKEYKLSSILENYLKINKASKLWKTDQIERRKRQGKILIDLIGDRCITQVDREDLRRFSDLIKLIPYRSDLVEIKFKLSGANTNELIDFSRRNKLKTITLLAQRKILEGVKSIFDWSLKEGIIEKNPVLGLSNEIPIKRNKKAQEERMSLTNEMLNSIFSLEWYHTGSGSKTKSGRYHSFSPHYYWLPVMGLYTGGRLNELCQLSLSDFKKTDDGVEFIEITVEDEEGNIVETKSLKTTNSKRVVPIHHRLIDLGLLEYCSALRAAGHDRLFPELSHNARKGYGKAAGSWFNERLMGKKLGIPRDARYTFHSFRHNYATALSLTSIQRTLKADLMGHQRSEDLVELRYEKGVTPDVLKTYINEMKFELPPIAAFNISEGLVALTHALRRKK